MWVTEDRRNRDAPIEAGEALCEPVGDVQQLDVVQSLPMLLRGDDAEQCLQQIVPHVQQVLPTSSMEIQIAASNTFLSILEKELVHPTTFTQTFLQSILSSIDSTDPVVANAWLETLLDSIDLLPAEIVRKEILHIAVAKGQLSQPVSARLACCKLIGKMATKFESFLIKKELLPVVQSLFQDVSPEVRSCLCSQLGWVARGLGPELAPSTLLPPLVELANDEEVMVRLAAVHSVVDLLGIVDEETCKQTIIPLVKKICENALHTEDAVLATISYQLGKLYLGLSAYLSVEEKGWFLDFFQQLALLGVSHLSQTENIHLKPMPDVVPVLQENADMYAEVRRHCAFNIPAMFLFASSHDDFHQRLYPTFCDLVCDPHVDVRRTVASGVHEVARLLGPENRMLKNELVHLLCDETQEVLSAVVPNLSAILLLMTKFKNIGPDLMGTSVVEIGRAILKCEETISRTYNWRLHSSLLSQLECLPHCLPADYILSHLVPVLFLRIHKARPLPCRSAAARTLLIFLRYNVKQKDQLLNKIRTEISQAKTFRLQMIYLEMCSMAMKIFSASYFKSNFFMSVLDLSSESVPNIRLKVCHMFPCLKGVLNISPDKKLLKAMETCIQALMLKETDRDVCAALSMVIDKLDAMEKNSDSFPPEHFDEDKRKQEEEEKLERILEDGKKGVGIGSLVPSKSGPLLMEKLNRGTSFSKSVSAKDSKTAAAAKTGSATKFSSVNTVQHQIRSDDTKIGMKSLHTSKIPGHSIVRKGVANLEMKAQKMPVKDSPAPSSSVGFRGQRQHLVYHHERKQCQWHSTIAYPTYVEGSSFVASSHDTNRMGCYGNGGRPRLGNYLLQSSYIGNEDHYKPLSSPMMPDTLDPTTDEFYIDAGVRIQTTLSNKTSPVPRSTCIPIMRVPTIREMLFSSRKQEALSEYQQAIGVTSICSLSATQSEVLSGITSPHIQSSYGVTGNMLGVKRSNISGKSGMNTGVKSGSATTHKTKMVVASCSDLPTPSQPYIFPIKNSGEEGDEQQNESSHNIPRKGMLYSGNKRLQYSMEGTKSALDRTNNDIKSSGSTTGTTTNPNLQSNQLHKPHFTRTGWSGSPRGSQPGNSSSARPQSCILPQSGGTNIPSHGSSLRNGSRSLSQEELNGVGSLQQQTNMQRGSLGGAAGRRISSSLFKSPPLPSGRVPRRPGTSSAHSSPGSSRASSPGSRLQGTSGFSGAIQSIRHTSNGSSLLVRALPMVKKQRSVSGGVERDVTSVGHVESPEKRVNGGVRGRQRQSTGISLPHEESSENISRRWILKKDDTPNWRRKSVDGSSLMVSGGRRTSQRPLSVGGGITASTSRLPVPTLRKT